MREVVALIITALLLSACVTPNPVFDSGTPCEADSFTVIDGFGGARRGRCEVIAPNHVQVSILPEDDGYINPSPWYAFKLVPATATTARISLNYVGGQHRYVPKVSSDGLTWSPLSEQSVEISEDGTVAEIEVPLEDNAVWISAQELITPAIYAVWSERIALQTDAELHELGYSVAKQPIQYLLSSSSANDVLFIVGRQHPPEVSGVFAFFSFTETLLAETDLARRFREHFQIIAIPLLNPDGVLGGNWRHNLRSTDLNRDWGPFKQPETRLVRELLDSLDANAKQVKVFLDFHSTDRNLFYTPDESVPTEPPDFFATWFARATPRLIDYSFSNEPRGVDKRGVAKNYMYRRYGIPTATYEVGDETDRLATRAAARVFAEELMALMLETLADTQ